MPRCDGCGLRHDSGGHHAVRVMVHGERIHYCSVTCILDAVQSGVYADESHREHAAARGCRA